MVQWWVVCVLIYQSNHLICVVVVVVIVGERERMIECRIDVRRANERMNEGSCSYIVQSLRHRVAHITWHFFLCTLPSSRDLGDDDDVADVADVVADDDEEEDGDD